MNLFRCFAPVPILIVAVGSASVSPAQQLAPAVESLKQLDTRVLGRDADAQHAAREAVRLDARNRIRAANLRETAAWRELKSRADWQAYRDRRIDALRESLRLNEKQSSADIPLNIRVTRRIEGDGYQIHNLLFQRFADVDVAANLYLPAKTGGSMPGILICHSHHAPKHQGELQAMGVTWARSGCAVLVMDQLGHGERRLHKFAAADAYSGSFRPERQDYYFRYNLGVQLQLASHSLIGWMVGDLMRGVDVLLAQPGIDPRRIILLGAVAGGGDPAGVTGALDPRIACVVPFNFGGYEPEDVYPLPDDAETTFNYSGSGSWESTRNMAWSIRDGFQPWVIIGSVAPRHLIYAHEFRWDEPRDPVWKRLRQVFAWHEADDRLSFVVGKGTVKGKSPEASHCTNIGALHRAQIYPALQRWFDMPIPAEPMFERYTADDLRCATDEAGQLRLGKSVLEHIERHDASILLTLAALRQRRPPRNHDLAQSFARLLGDTSPAADTKATTVSHEQLGALIVERIRIDVPGQEVVIPLPLVIVRAASTPAAPRVVLGISQSGKEALLAKKRDQVAALVDAGAAVVLADLRGTGETEPEAEGRGRTGGATSRSSTEMMLGRTTLGLRVGDVRTILAYLRARDDLRGCDFALWGEGLVVPNPADRDLAAPLDAEKLPQPCEPLGMLAGLLAALWEEDVRAVYAAGGLTSFQSLLAQPYFYVPHDCVIPGVLTVADIPDLVQAVSSTRRVKLIDQRDALNRAVPTGPQAEAETDAASFARWLVARP